MNTGNPLSEGGTFTAKVPVRTEHVVLAVGLTAAFLAYSGTLAFGFVYDDRAQVIGNPWIHSWKSTLRYFSVNVWGLHSPTVLGNYYRPLFFLWLRVNYVLFGLDPWGWHLTSVLIHLGVALLVYYLAVRIIVDRVSSAVAASIFALHPVHIEPVAWISGVTDPSMALFFVSSFLCFLRAKEADRKRNLWLGISLLLFAAAMLAKETALVLPLVIFVYEWIYRLRAGELSGRAERLRAALRLTLPHLLLVPAYLVARWAALKGFSHAISPVPVLTIVSTWPSLLWFYLRLLVWPAGLSPCYDTPYVSRPDFIGFIAPLAGLAGVGLLVALWGRRSRREDAEVSGPSRSNAILFSAAWLCLPVLPLLNLAVFQKGDIAHDRYMYLPSVGFSLVVTLVLRELPASRRIRWGWPASQAVAATVIGGLLGLGTVMQSGMWADDLLLYSRGMAAAPRNPVVKMNLANLACQRGLYGTGINLYKQVIEQNPEYWLAYYNLGYTHYRIGNLKEADRYLTIAVQKDVLHPPAFMYLALTRMKLGRPREAEPLLRHAIRVAPEGSKLYHFALAMALVAAGDLRGALEELKTELRVNPEEPAVREQILEIQKQLGSDPDAYRAR